MPTINPVEYYTTKGKMEKYAKVTGKIGTKSIQPMLMPMKHEM